MVDSALVLEGLAVTYTLYVVAILALVGWFAWRVTRSGAPANLRAGWFYAFVGLLVTAGVTLHVATYRTLPWKELDMNRANIKADKVFDITVAAHRFQLPAEKLRIDCDDKVLFNVTSSDLTYGFGLFRQDNSMLFQMQVIPGHKNDILWHFDRPGIYTIRSTEYSGPAGVDMKVPDAVLVSCEPNKAG
jgi:cytochrome c oxidase subunit 2